MTTVRCIKFGERIPSPEKVCLNFYCEQLISGDGFIKLVLTPAFGWDELTSGGACLCFDDHECFRPDILCVTTKVRVDEPYPPHRILAAIEVELNISLQLHLQIHTLS